MNMFLHVRASALKKRKTCKNRHIMLVKTLSSPFISSAADWFRAESHEGLLVFCGAFWYFALACVCQAKWTSPIPLVSLLRTLTGLCQCVSFVKTSHVSMAAQMRFSEGKTCDVWVRWPGVTGLFSVRLSREITPTNITIKLRGNAEYHVLIYIYICTYITRHLK